MRTSIRASSYDAATGLYANGSNRTGVPDARVTSFTQAFAVAFDIAEPAEYAPLFALLNDMTRRSTMMSLRQVVEMAAYARAGATRAGIAWLKRSWLPLLKQGHRRFFEDIDPTRSDAAQRSKCGRPYGNSLCHVWAGAAPVLLLSKGVLGIEATQPGFAEVSVRSRPSGFVWGKGTAPPPPRANCARLDRHDPRRYSAYRRPRHAARRAPRHGRPRLSVRYIRGSGATHMTDGANRVSGWRRSAIAITATMAAVSSPLAASAQTIRTPLAATPPMGWNPWNAFRTEVDEAKILANARLLVRLGLADAGYRYVNIDDGWWLRREADGRIRIRTGIFPSAARPDGSTSFRPFVDRLHGMGLKAGIYTDIGRNNCAQHWGRDSPNLPEGTQRQREVGTLGFQDEDARQFFGEWGFDYAKIDACGLADYGPDSAGVRDGTYRGLSPMIDRRRPADTESAVVESLYARFAHSVRAVAPAAVLEFCAWGEADVGDWAGRYSQLWRTSPDISSKWSSMLANFDSAARRSLFAGPGRWNHPDMLEVGNGDFDGAHLTEARAHMSLWAIIAAPLILSTDLSKASPDIVAILGNRDVIAVNQDPAGHQGVILSETNDASVLVKSLARAGHKAVALVNRSDRPIIVGVDLAELRIADRQGVVVRDLWTRQSVSQSGTRIERSLAPRETALLRVEGQTADAGTIFADDVPADIMVVDPGTAGAPPRSKSWVAARIGFHPGGEPVMTNGRHDHGALGVAAGSRLRIALAGRFRSVEVTPTGTATARYEILGDGRVLHSAIGDGQAIRISAVGVRSLELRAPSASGDDTRFAWADLRMHRR